MTTNTKLAILPVAILPVAILVAGILVAGILIDGYCVREEERAATVINKPLSRDEAETILMHTQSEMDRAVADAKAKYEKQAKGVK